jgi:hypothetical protein
MLVDAARVASIDALHVAAGVCAALLLGGAFANWVGLRPGTDEDDDRGG